MNEPIQERGLLLVVFVERLLYAKKFWYFMNGPIQEKIILFLLFVIFFTINIEIADCVCKVLSNKRKFQVIKSNPFQNTNQIKFQAKMWILFVFSNLLFMLILGQGWLSLVVKEKLCRDTVMVVGNFILMVFDFFYAPSFNSSLLKHRATRCQGHSYQLEYQERNNYMKII